MASAMAAVLLLGLFGMVDSSSVEGTIAFFTVGRFQYGFDIFLANVGDSNVQEMQLTDGVSVNYNGFLVDTIQQRHLLRSQGISDLDSYDNRRMLAYVSERDGSVQIHFSTFYCCGENHTDHPGSRAALEVTSLPNVMAYSSDEYALYDRPSLVGGKIVFTSTRQARKEAEQSWNAVYSQDVSGGKITRLTPDEMSDLSPSVSPSGKWTMVAGKEMQSYRQPGEQYDEIDTDLYVFKTRDGSSRKMVLANAGWPSWANESTVYFHRKAADGWWSIFQATFDDKFRLVKEEERMTPPGFHAMTPAASKTGEWIAVATRRTYPGYRHVEIFNVTSRSFTKLTEDILPDAQHYNPFVSSDSKHVGYHRCRGKTSPGSLTPRLEHIKSPFQRLAMFRVYGEFPTFSPDGRYIACIPDMRNGGIYVMELDGSVKTKIFSEKAFALSWDRKKEGVIYITYGLPFEPAKSRKAHIAAILNADKLLKGTESKVRWKILTKGGSGNNAFPSGSPDGKLLVFRSGRSGHMNLYIMDAEGGETKYLKRLTEGVWNDTMPTWSPDGEWIAFSSNRNYIGTANYEIYLIHPNGTGLHKLFNSSLARKENHAVFSPDSQSLIFTTDMAGLSTEPISAPAQAIAIGEIYMSRLDGSGLQRLTHNGYEDGTPAWGPLFGTPSKSDGEPLCCVFDDSY